MLILSIYIINYDKNEYGRSNGTLQILTSSRSDFYRARKDGCFSAAFALGNHLCQ